MLTVIKIRHERAGEKMRRLYDSGGLYLEITPAGSKLWRWKYRLQGRERRLALGAYPDVSLAAARAARDDRLQPHGLRALFSTTCNDRKFASEDIVDAALAHVQTSSSKRPYDRGVRLKLRQRLMQRWADHIDRLCASSGVDFC